MYHCYKCDYATNNRSRINNHINRTCISDEEISKIQVENKKIYCNISIICSMFSLLLWFFYRYDGQFMFFIMFLLSSICYFYEANYIQKNGYYNYYLEQFDALP